MYRDCLNEIAEKAKHYENVNNKYLNELEYCESFNG